MVTFCIPLRIHRKVTDELMHKLSRVTFVQSVESPALAMVIPLLLRGLCSRSKATVRQSAVIIDNMCRLVDDPIDSAPFMPLLMPALEKAADILSDPEAQSVAEQSLDQLKRLNAEVEEAKTRQQHNEQSRVLEALKEKYGFNGTDEKYLCHAFEDVIINFRKGRKILPIFPICLFLGQESLLLTKNLEK
jgi:hypothetical protein